VTGTKCADQDAPQFSNCQRNAACWLIPVCVAEISRARQIAVLPKLSH
jgi:hypothetical protein